MGFHPAPPIDYGARYFQEFIDRDHTPMGDALTLERMRFVQRNSIYPLVDIGIGGGRFVTDFGCDGYDVNPLAVQWLKDHCKFVFESANRLANHLV